MKKLIFLLFLTNIAVAQKKMAIVITGYDNMADSFRVSNVTFADTSYWHIPYTAWTVFEKDSVYYNLCQELTYQPKKIEDYPICNFYIHTDFWGSWDFYNAYPVLYYLARQKLVHLGKL